MSSWSTIKTIAKREFSSYFTSPVAYVFIVIFLALQGVLTFNLGNYFDRNQADLAPFEPEIAVAERHRRAQRADAR